MAIQLQLFNRLETLDRLISIKSTGKPASLAKRIGISERSLYDFLDLMRDLGAPISYCKKRETYYYTEKGRFDIRFNKCSRYTRDEVTIRNMQTGPDEIYMQSHSSHAENSL